MKLANKTIPKNQNGKFVLVFSDKAKKQCKQAPKAINSVKIVAELEQLEKTKCFHEQPKIHEENLKTWLMFA